VSPLGSSRLCKPSCTCERHQNSGGIPCPPQCTCPKHRPPQNAGKKSPCPSGCTCGRHFHSAEHTEKVRQSQLGRVFTAEHREKLSKVHHALMQQSNSFNGGPEGDVYATILCPVGFVREHWVELGRPPRRTRGGSLPGGRYRFDFAHLEGKIDIELDGPCHFQSREEDAKRDAVLRALGWKIIRIKHR